MYLKALVRCWKPKVKDVIMAGPCFISEWDRHLHKVPHIDGIKCTQLFKQVIQFEMWYLYIFQKPKGWLQFVAESPGCERTEQMHANAALHSTLWWKNVTTWFSPEIYQTYLKVLQNTSGSKSKLPAYRHKYWMTGQ